MKKINITTDQWIEIHKTLRNKMPIWHLPHLKEIFEIHKNEKMILEMNEIRKSIKALENDSK